MKSFTGMKPCWKPRSLLEAPPRAKRPRPPLTSPITAISGMIHDHAAIRFAQASGGDDVRSLRDLWARGGAS
ncbi:hypothetical protein L614_001200000400 [Ochrobactrum sp. J50]|jgi:hypothetical protein|nr:hypothetical protein L614_001200000400 [Ochrobactrum sp. J50]